MLPTKQRGLSVSVSVGLSVTLLSPEKTAEPIEIPIPLRTRVDLKTGAKTNFVGSGKYISENKNSSGDEIANVNFCTTTTYM